MRCPNLHGIAEGYDRGSGSSCTPHSDQSFKSSTFFVSGGRATVVSASYRTRLYPLDCIKLKFQGSVDARRSAG